MPAKAFIFDVDGVIIDTESAWEEAKKDIYSNNLEPEILAKLGPTLGVSIEGIYNRAADLGSKVSKAQLLEAFHQKAKNIYVTARITPGLERLAQTLVDLGVVMGVVSASPLSWIQTTL